MNGYIAYYGGKKVEVLAETKYAAQQEAAKFFNAKKAYDVAVVLCEVDGKQYVNVADF